MEETYFQKAYRFFNSRDVDSLLAMMDETVDWPNGWEGGYVKGRKAVRDYWTRQWKEIDPNVEPLEISILPDGRYEVLVQQLVKDLQGNVLADAQVKHIYSLKDQLITRMEIEQS